MPLFFLGFLGVFFLGEVLTDGNGGNITSSESWLTVGFGGEE